jgi:integrase
MNWYFSYTTPSFRTKNIKISYSIFFFDCAIFNKKIKVLVTNEKRKTLHSIRHFVATKLKKKITNDSMIKTILGHTENDTLNNIYAKEGYSLQQINEAIQLL